MFKRLLYVLATLIAAIFVFQWLTAASFEFDSPSTTEALSEKYTQILIKSHDGTTIGLTLYQPQLAAGENAPLILHTNGFGGTRAARPLSLYGQLMLSGTSSIAAWHRGYWMISFDQRGVGESGDEIHLMDPDFEVKDFSAVIDWAIANIPRISKDDNGDAIIGAVGESYGGGSAVNASLRDPRIDAIVPLTTWWDLSDAFGANRHVKSAWGGTLGLLGTFSSGFDFGMAIEPEYLALFNGYMNDKVDADMDRRSPMTYCAQGMSIQADALFIQGFKDTLFPLNQGLNNRACALTGGKDVRFVGIQDGHKLWPIQPWSGLPIFNTQETIVCDGQVFDTQTMILDWLDEKLKGITPSQEIPKLCLTFSDDSGRNLEQVTYGGESFVIPSTIFHLTPSGLLEGLLDPLDSLMDRISPLAEQPVLQTTGGSIRPAFVPLYQASTPMDLLGVPLIDVNFTSTESEHDGVGYLALGVRKAGKRHIEILSDQYLPLPGDGLYQQEFPAVSFQLHTGDEVGVVLQGFTWQYLANSEGLLSSGTVAGHIALPLIAPRTLSEGLSTQSF
ncbi:MAG: X-Pro dipeptidyl-peptidase [Thalassobium sp.]|nr:MAG: X-Pro dipeptidyl-peptidase [Thalassobium sp.]PHQ88222.1 MAG: X-Pro dipeptidyl-peptidase [Thalassobium sp.]